MMRGRHTAAILTMMGMAELIADSLESYVDLAVRLGLDPAWRRSISERIRSQKHKLVGDLEAVRGLERFLRSAVCNF